ncbi:MarR family winged helix-turn-helix transcriptional regulator [Jiangella sp. DSM 45060]|uniref:MarR family winged helix-turn-helix transcriptional regulator n=1 Tax=Jiangella sp. DSM 45060 TaxID=1798224 RepID=UPI000B87D8DF|nr:MarR family transcriptional regulator [Jiangella sp. DSM 45060]
MDSMELASALERLVRLFRQLTTAGDLSLTAAATLATLERTGPRRLTELAVQEGVTQPAMTQLVARLHDAGLVERSADPADGRVVRVGLADAGRAALAARREARADRLAALLATLDPATRAALEAAVPAIDALTASVPTRAPDRTGATA